MQQARRCLVMCGACDVLAAACKTTALLLRSPNARLAQADLAARSRREDDAAMALTRSFSSSSASSARMKIFERPML
eukprot:758744-Hanusia_phi.AAC.4